MGYPVPANAPQITASGRTFIVAAFPFESVVSLFKVGIYERQPDGAWNEVLGISTYTEKGAFEEIQKLGGGAAYMKHVMDTANAFFADLFGAHVPVPVPTAEPLNESDARAYITAHVNAFKLVLVNGVPTLSV